MIKILINTNLIMNKMSTKMEMNLVNRVFFLIKVLLIILNLILLIKFPPKWFTKFKIFVSHDYHFTIIAMIDSDADMNCIQEGLISSKYFEKSTKRLVFANGTQMKNMNWIMLMFAMVMSASRFLIFLLKIWLIRWSLVCHV